MRYIFIVLIAVSLYGLDSLDKDYLMEQRLKLLPEQYQQLKKDMITQNKKNKTKHLTMIYLFSTSVPSESYIRILKDIQDFNSKRKEKIDTMQALVGFDASIKDYLQNIGPILEKENISELMHIRIAPELFHKVRVEKVPALVLARCESNQHPSDCSVLSVARGDISFYAFIEMLEKDNNLPKELL